MQYNQPFDQPLAPNAPYVDGNATTGVPGSIPRAAAIEYPQREILNAAGLAGLTAVNGDLTQLAQAMSIGLWLGAMSGSANAITDTMPTLATTSDGVTQYAIPALVVGMTFHGIIPATNTGPTTLALTGFGTAPGAKPIVRKDGTPVQAGDLPGGAIVSWRWDGTAYRVTGVVASDVLALIASNAPAAVNATKTTLIFPSSTTWACPPGVTRVKAQGRGAGAGAGGSYQSSNAGGGGGGGAFFSGLYTVVPGTTYAITVGVGGSGGSGSIGDHGQNGSATSFASFATAPGGIYGVGGNTSTPIGAGGAGGAIATSVSTATGVPILYPGTAGTYGSSSPTYTGGSGGGCYGQGTVAGIPLGSGGGGPGVFPGLGGTAAGGANFNGGAGGPGELILEF